MYQLLIIILCIFSPMLYCMEESIVRNAITLNPIIEHAQSIVKANQSAIPPLIGITGCSGVGKSHFANTLSMLLNNKRVNAKILKGDDFLDPDHYAPDHFHPYLNHALMHACIQKIKNGETVVTKPIWNHEALRPPSKIEEQFSVNGVDLLLFEGEFTLCATEPYDFGKYINFGIFIDADVDNIIEWDWKRGRDIKEKTKDELIANRTPCIEKYRTYVQSCTETALYLIKKNKDHEYHLTIRNNNSPDSFF